MGFDSEVGCGCVTQYHVADFREADQKRLNNVYRLAYLPLVLIVFSFDNEIHWEYDTRNRECLLLGASGYLKLDLTAQL